MGRRVDIAPGAYLLLAAWLIWLPVRFWLGALFAAGIHELGHLLAVYLCGGQVIHMEIGLGGARMDSTPVTSGKGMVCALAGPAASFSLLVLTNIWPEAALCALLQGCYNLLPLWPLDGGRAVRYLLPGAFCAGLEMFTLIFLWGLALWLSVQMNLGWLPLIFPLFLVLQRKLACKESCFAVQ